MLVEGFPVVVILRGILIAFENSWDAVLSQVNCDMHLHHIFVASAARKRHQIYGQ